MGFVSVTQILTYGDVEKQLGTEYAHKLFSRYHSGEYSSNGMLIGFALKEAIRDGLKDGSFSVGRDSLKDDYRSTRKEYDLDRMGYAS